MIPKRNTPKYEIVKASLLETIRRKKSGDKMPTEMELQKKFGVSRITAIRAANDLVNQGLLYREQGRGTFVSPEANAHQQKTMNIGFASYLKGDPQKLAFAPDLFEIFSGIQKEAAAENYSVIFLPSIRDDRPAISILNLGREKNVDGLLFLGMIDDSLLFELQREDYPLVIMDHHTDRIKVDCVAFDNVGGGREITNCLLGLGHIEIAYIHGLKTESDIFGVASEWVSSRERFTGYRQALADHGFEVSPDMVQQGQAPDPVGSVEGGYAAMQPLLNLKRPPTAIFAFSDYMAAGAIRAIRDRGLRVPEDISVAGFGNIPMTDSPLPLTTMGNGCEMMGQLAVKRLIARIGGDQGETTTTLIPLKLIVRESTLDRKSK